MFLVLKNFLLTQAMASDLPIQGTDVARRWDNLYRFELWLSVFFFILVVGGMIYLAWRYRAGMNPKPKYITGSHLIEAIWTVIPTILLMVIFGWGYVVYNSMTNAPSDAYEVRVIGKQWLWQFYYNDGRNTTNELYVPANQPVKLIMTSEDVLHSFFVPNFRIKQDVVPGMYTSVWFEATVPGKHQIYCAEYCGASHSLMLGKVIALEKDQWEQWQRGKKLGSIPDATAVARNGETSDAMDGRKPVITHESAMAPLHEQGRNLAQLKGCVACHTSDGTEKIGPSFKGIYGKKVEFTDGTFAVRDENYIRQSIEEPQAHIVKGYGKVMPTFKGQMTEPELAAMVSYIKSLK